MRYAIIAALLLSGVGCRPEIEGAWEGTVNGAPARLHLDQGGSKIEGEMCEFVAALGDEACAVLSRGLLEDNDLTLRYGCGNAACRLPSTTLELELLSGGEELEGVGWREGCGCNEATCDCSVEAHFTAR